MQLFMHNIPFQAKETELKIAFAKVLHRPPFPGEINFEVDHFRNKTNPRVGRGFGLLTLPNTDVGNIFLRTYGTNGVSFLGRQIRFKMGDRQNEALIAKVAAEPWVDPKKIVKERERAQRDSSALNLVGFSFGRLCRDGTYSPEVERIGPAKIACDIENRAVRWSFDVQATPTESPSSWLDPLESFDFSSVFNEIFGGQALSAWLRSSQVRALSFSTTGSRVFIESLVPPVFETAKHQALILDGKPPSPERLPSLIDDTKLAPVYNLVCLEFGNRSDVEVFLNRCDRIHIRHQYEHDIPIAKRDLYAEEHRVQVDALMKDIHFGLAFEVEKAIVTSVLDFTEISQLAVRLRNLDRKRELLEHEAASRARHFFANLHVPSLKTWNGTLPPPVRPKRNHRRRHRHNRPELVNPTLVQQFDRAMEDYRKLSQLPRSRFATSAGVYQSYQLVITPSGRILEGPLIDQSNDVLRRFGNHDCFLRVAFQDENRSMLRRDPTFSTTITGLLKSRYKGFLTGGLRVAGRDFEFLGYSMSGLREHSVSFVSPFKNEKGELMTAEKIRSTLGDFSLIVQKPALLGARWSQAFSASDPTVELLSTERKDIPDRVSRNKSVFTDGCGTISSELMRSVWTHLQGKKRNAARKRAPSAVQIRFGGAKGVVVVDPALRGRQICLRPSQVKFPNDTATVLNIAATSSRPIRMFLNRPLICILEFLGVQEEAFLDLQTDAIQEVERARSSFREAAKLLTQHNLGSSFRLSSFMNNCVQQLRLRDDDIQTGVLHCKPLEKALEFCATHVLREIKFRAHVLVPDSYTLIGVPDESESLREGEIYATVWDEANSIHVEVEGRVAITRSPQIHPGDVQMVTAVRRPELMHLRNVVVFSCEGARSLPSCLGGGDLDGDVYNLILNPTLFPTRCYEPGSYVGLPHKQTVNPCTVTDVADFVVEYIESDLVGIISISHLRIADLEDPSCGDCLKLAELASHAVDFPKTGTPVRIDSLPRPPKGPKPDFLANEIMDPSAEVNFYPSKKALGVLFRNVPLQDQEAVDGISTFGSRLTRAVNQLPTGRFGLAPPGHASEDLLVEMDALLADYTYQLTDIAKAHIMSKRPEDRLTEAELISGTIQAKWVDHRKRREAVVSMNMQTLELTRNVRRELKRVVYDPVVDGSQHEDEEDDEEDDEDSESEDGDEKLTERDVESFARASAAWEVALDALEEDNTAFGPASFGIVALGVMLEGYKKARLL